MERKREAAVEIAIRGEGEVVIRFIDRQGRTLLQERLVVSGPPGVQARRYVSLSIGTVRGRAELVPVLASRGNPRQRVTFDGLDPARYARRRGKAIGCGATVTRDAARGIAPAPKPRGPGLGAVGEPAMADVLRTGSGRGTAR
jgi:hypothetical protein